VKCLNEGRLQRVNAGASLGYTGDRMSPVHFMYDVDRRSGKYRNITNPSFPLVPCPATPLGLILGQIALQCV